MLPTRSPPEQYSSPAGTRPRCAASLLSARAAHTWRRSVDWLFWNIFTYNDQRGWSFDKFLSEGYSRFLGKSGVPQEFGGKTYTVNYAQFPWALLER